VEIKYKGEIIIVTEVNGWWKYDLAGSDYGHFSSMFEAVAHAKALVRRIRNG